MRIFAIWKIKGDGSIFSRTQVYLKNRTVPFYLIWCLMLGILPGCASIKEKLKGFAGTSTKELEAGRASAIVKTFDYDYFSAFTKSLDALKNMKSYIYAQDIKKNMIAIYISEEDTTPVGIFFKEISVTSTQVEVSSPSIFAKELISGKLFQALKEKSQEEKGKIK